MPTALTRTPSNAPLPGVRYARAELTDRSSLVSALRDVDVVVHAAGYTGPDEHRCEAVNLEGTANVLAAADILGIEFVVNISTVGTYGPGPFRGVLEDTREPDPVTRLSATRAVADRLVRARGGTTVLPGFVHGPGDRWFRPGLRHILSTLGAWVDDGDALLSTIAVDELGALIAHLARTCSTADRGALFHAAHPATRSVREIATTLTGKDFPLPAVSRSYVDASARASSVGLTARQIDLVGRDHTIDGSRLWRRTGRTPGGLRPGPR